MHLSRRTVLKGVGTLPLAAGNFGFSAFAQAPSAAPSATEVPPVLFVHGNGDHAALWITTLWRMESNGSARPDVCDQFHRSTGANRRFSAATKSLLDGRPAPRTWRGHQGIATPHRPVARC